MITSNIEIKDSVSTLRLFCQYCIKEKNRSKKFSTYHALKWHLKNCHENKKNIQEFGF